MGAERLHALAREKATVWLRASDEPTTASAKLTYLAHPEGSCVATLAARPEDNRTRVDGEVRMGLSSSMPTRTRPNLDCGGLAGTMRQLMPVLAAFTWKWGRTARCTPMARRDRFRCG
ncbi:hypothetical protein GCM10011319_37880 [Mameliella alba]|nr:hypothetical protein GCM10011319_37880 [Mameliella alba]